MPYPTYIARSGTVSLISCTAANACQTVYDTLHSETHGESKIPIRIGVTGHTHETYRTIVNPSRISNIHTLNPNRINS